MFVIRYQQTKGTKTLEKVYASPADFIAAQLREVPDLQDFFPIVSVSVNGKEVSELSGKTVEAAFRAFQL